MVMLLLLLLLLVVTSNDAAAVAQAWHLQQIHFLFTGTLWWHCSLILVPTSSRGTVTGCHFHDRVLHSINHTLSSWYIYWCFWDRSENCLFYPELGLCVLEDAQPAYCWDTALCDSVTRWRWRHSWRHSLPYNKLENTLQAYS